MHAAFTLGLALSVVVTAPSPRDQARALYAAGKKLCQSGDADGCLAKRLEGHEHFPNVKVMKAIVARYDELDDATSAAAFLEAAIASRKPANAMAWSKKRLKAYRKAMAKAEEAKPPAAGAAAAGAAVGVPTPASGAPTPSADAAPSAGDPAATKATGPAAKDDGKGKEDEKRRRLAETKARARDYNKKQAKLEAQAIEDRESERTKWMVLGWSSAALAMAATAGGIVLALDAQSENDAAKACQSDLDTFGGGCSEAAFQSHRDAQVSSTTTAFISAAGAAAAAAAATTFLYFATQVGEATPTSGSTILQLGPGSAWLMGRF